MRIVVLVLLAGPLAWAQLPQTQAQLGPPNHPPLFQLPNAGAPRFQWNPNLSMPPSVESKIVPPPRIPQRDAQVDPGILLRPSPTRIGTLPPAREIAQNQFPGLRFQPIDATKPSLEKIPTRWPLMRLEPIPTGCSACSLDPAVH